MIVFDPPKSVQPRHLDAPPRLPQDGFDADLGSTSLLDRILQLGEARDRLAMGEERDLAEAAYNAAYLEWRRQRHKIAETARYMIEVATEVDPIGLWWALSRCAERDLPAQIEDLRDRLERLATRFDAIEKRVSALEKRQQEHDRDLDDLARDVVRIEDSAPRVTA